MTEVYFNKSKVRPGAKGEPNPLSPKLKSWWHKEKNAHGRHVDYYSAGSHIAVWWKCNKGHEWHEQIVQLSKRDYCNYCAKKLASPQFNLALIHPEIASEWHTKKNPGLGPCDVLPGSGKRVWWLCAHGHEWHGIIGNRTHRNGKCPECVRQSRGGKRPAEAIVSNESQEAEKSKAALKKLGRACVNSLAFSKCWG
jgi:hypothetical protein